MSLSSFESWLMIGLVTTMAAMLGYFGQKIVKGIDYLTVFAARQEELNVSNEVKHAEISNTVKEHAEAIQNHEVRISVIEKIPRGIL